jgi:uncharacterized coiled-coil protein SlyX
MRLDFYLHDTNTDKRFGIIADWMHKIELWRKLMANDLTALETVVAALEAKVAETNVTLGGLAQAVVDLGSAQDKQAAIDALTVRGQAILDSLAAAEDAADDKLPVAPV